MALDIVTLQAALIGYQVKHDELTAKMAEIRKRIRHGGDEPFPLTKGLPSPRKKRKMSAAARKRMAAAQKKRWAAFHKGKKVEAVSELPKAKRRISEEGLKRIIAATKKRWAAKRAAAAKPGPAVKKAAAKKAAGLFRARAQAKNSQRKDGREHDGHEEIAQEDTDHEQPAEFAEDQKSHDHVQHTVKTKHFVSGAFLQQTRAREAANQKEHKAEGRQIGGAFVAEGENARFVRLEPAEEPPV